MRPNERIGPLFARSTVCVVILPAESWDSLNRSFVQVNYPSTQGPPVCLSLERFSCPLEGKRGTPTGMTRLSSSLSGGTNRVSIFLSSLIRVQRETLGRTHLLLSLKEEYKIHSMYFYRNLKYPSVHPR